jgi:hypothetical protein
MVSAVNSLEECGGQVALSRSLVERLIQSLSAIKSVV